MARRCGRGWRPRGRLRISALLPFSHSALGRTAAAVSTYPEVRLEVGGGDRPVDLVQEGCDLPIRVKRSPDDWLARCCFLRDALLVAAASAPGPDGAEGGGVTVRGQRSAGAAGGWRVPAGGRVQTLLPDPVRRLSSLPMVRDAVLTRAEAGLWPRSMVAADLEAGGLRAGVEGWLVTFWALHPSRRLVSDKATAFMRCLARRSRTGCCRRRRRS